MRGTAFLEPIRRERRQLKVYSVLALVALGLVGGVYFAGQPLFQPFIGTANPVAAALLVVVLGYLTLLWLVVNGDFVIYRHNNRRGLVHAAMLAGAFGAVAILSDFRIVYPADINILLPWSLLFYPSIGFFVEILFHALPLAVLLALTARPMPAHRDRVVLLCILAVAVLEPVYQVQWMRSSGVFTLWATAFVALHVFLINFVQLLLFRRYDFVTMLAFRLMYYLIWHIGWGTFRLSILF